MKFGTLIDPQAVHVSFGRNYFDRETNRLYINLGYRQPFFDSDTGRMYENLQGIPEKIQLRPAVLKILSERVIDLPKPIKIPTSEAPVIEIKPFVPINLPLPPVIDFKPFIPDNSYSDFNFNKPKFKPERKLGPLERLSRGLPLEDDF